MKKFRLYVVVWLLSAATLLMETVLSRIFSVVFFNNYAFLVVSLALLGYALAGVYLALSARLRETELDTLIPPFAGLLFAGMLFMIYVLRHVPLDLMALGQSRIQWFYLFIYTMSVIIPFFTIGFFMARLFTDWTVLANRLYFWDLVGAGVGSIVILIVLRPFGGMGTLILSYLAILFALVIFAETRKARVVTLLFVIAGSFLLLEGEQTFEISPLVRKRMFNLKNVEYSEWGPLTRIDVQPFFKGRKIIWINMGSNQSFMTHWGRDILEKPSSPPLRFSLPYYLKFKKLENVLIVGPAGGYEVSVALLHGAKHVTGVEMDPTIVKIVLGPYNTFLNGIYHDPRVTLVNDEGRSYIHRSEKVYDVIQQIYNATPIAIMSGALNLSETYLLTREAFEDYWNHLSPQGYLSIHRWGGVRLLIQGYDLLKRHGIKDPFQHMALIQENSWLAQSFLLSKKPLSKEEIRLLKRYAKKLKARTLWIPGEKPGHPLIKLYVSTKNPLKVADQLFRNERIDIRPVTDDRPFFNQFIPLWHGGVKSKYLEHGMFQMLENQLKSTGTTLWGLLGFTLLLGAVTILLPLLRFQRGGLPKRTLARTLFYFSGLGFGFIFIEVCLFQILVLFLGSPAYSIPFVLASLLILAGTGSFIASRFSWEPVVLIRRVTPFLMLMIFIEIFILKDILPQFIHTSLLVRMVLVTIAIAPMALPMGVLFPVGLRWVEQEHPALVGWAWGMNGYTTVFGSVLAIILAMSAGFTVVFFLSILAYGMSYLSALPGLAFVRSAVSSKSVGSPGVTLDEP